uniref:Uncharacterized protein n=1 Tax=Chromera velia CCMP2878 TaxID=1169474 RepID=A0A0G4FZG6_9ALVE|eukprot:Cvel_19530.t1-p1 / transcript=Cvel_19530.t1 / gene=Cvel_19530 / organism=Chromera_velia_CCMP2878 / gene_product=hypothetical protein / transcript_product=hypothetical protein / location=Cvel_scaffold1691:6875-10036(+) / protein_length=299 / sequence_SO=supercontig / SO=protein_coding / is_pseudo=false
MGESPTGSWGGGLHNHLQGDDYGGHLLSPFNLNALGSSTPQGHSRPLFGDVRADSDQVGMDYQMEVDMDMEQSSAAHFDPLPSPQSGAGANGQKRRREKEKDAQSRRAGVPVSHGCAQKLAPRLLPSGEATGINVEEITAIASRRAAARERVQRARTGGGVNAGGAALQAEAVAAEERPGNRRSRAARVAAVGVSIAAAVTGGGVLAGGAMESAPLGESLLGGMTTAEIPTSSRVSVWKGEDLPIKPVCLHIDDTEVEDVTTFLSLCQGTDNGKERLLCLSLLSGLHAASREYLARATL